MMDASLSPMLCGTAKGVPADPENWILEPKLDGWRTVIHVQPDQSVVIYGGRNGKTYSGQIPYIEDALAANLPPDTILDGELISPEGWGGVQGVMTRSSAHVPSDVVPALNYVVFDALRLNGNDMRGLPWENRRSIIDMVEFPEHVTSTPVGEPSAEAVQAILDQGLEGVVFKRKDGTYSHGRSQTWLKFKAVDTLDAPIVGFDMGEGEFAGLIGAIKIHLPTPDNTAWSGIETTASGMNMELRQAMTARPLDYLGMMCEVAHNGWLDSGKVRHPRFKRMRDDREPVPIDEILSQPPPAAATTDENIDVRGATAPSILSAPAPKARAKPKGSWKRNYGAMGDGKLLQCIKSLENASGDAYQRVIDNGGVPELHLVQARQIAKDRGLI